MRRSSTPPTGEAFARQREPQPGRATPRIAAFPVGIALALVWMAARAPMATADGSCVRLAPLNASAARDTLGKERIDLLEKLNRRDRRHLWRLDSLVVPCSWGRDALEYSPLPREVTAFAEHPKVLLVEQAWQVFGGYENGVLVRWGPVSTGRQGDRTPPGRHHLTWRSRGRHSTVDPDWYMPWYFNFHNRRGLSFHQYALPGRPASHACVRMLERDARWLYGWGEGWTLDATRTKVLEHGTPVLIVGHYDFDALPPWRSPEKVAGGIAAPQEPLSIVTREPPAARSGATLTPHLGAPRHAGSGAGGGDR